MLLANTTKYYTFFQVLNALFALSNVSRDKEKGGINFDLI